MPSFLVIFHCGIPWQSFQHMLKTSWQAPETPLGVGVLVSTSCTSKAASAEQGRGDLTPVRRWAPGPWVPSGVRDPGTPDDFRRGRREEAWVHARWSDWIWSDENACSPLPLPKWMPCPPDQGLWGPGLTVQRPPTEEELAPDVRRKETPLWSSLPGAWTNKVACCQTRGDTLATVSQKKF